MRKYVQAPKMTHQSTPLCGRGRSAGERMIAYQIDKQNSDENGEKTQ